MPKHMRVTDHDPTARPLGCNGKYGSSGTQAHTRAGTAVCGACRASYNHYQRERRRGQGKPRIAQPCGTPAAADLHKRRGETLDFACRLALAQAAKAMRERWRLEAQTDTNTAGRLLVAGILRRRQYRCTRNGTHTPGQCPACGINREPIRKKAAA